MGKGTRVPSSGAGYRFKLTPRTAKRLPNPPSNCLGGDGVASVMIATILGFTALFLATTSKQLLIGVPTAPKTVRSILKIATEHQDVKTTNGALSAHLVPDQIMVALSIAFRPALTTEQIEASVAEIDQSVRDAHPIIVQFLLKPQSRSQFETLRATRGWRRPGANAATVCRRVAP